MLPLALVSHCLVKQVVASTFGYKNKKMPLVSVSTSLVEQVASL
jgi:hypothetical protein